MAGFSLDSISNLSPEFQSAFKKAIQAETRPIETLNGRKEKIQSKVTLLNDVIGKVDTVKKLLPEMNSPNALREISVISGNDKVLGAVAQKGKAAIGSHQIDILQMASPANALSNGFPDTNETRIGTGYFSVTTATGEEKEIFIDNDNATLEGLAKVINGSGIGMRAAIITDRSDEDAPYKLMLTTNKIGADNDITYPDFYFVDGEEDFYIDSERPATNALLRYEGQEVETPTNEVSDLIPGVTLTLRGVSGGPVSLNIEQDTPKTGAKIKGLVDGLNQVFSFIQQQNTIDGKSDTSGTLGGDYGIRNSENRLRSALTQSFLGGDQRRIRALADVGIQFNRNGTLNFDGPKLEKALADNFDEVAELIAGDGLAVGLVPKLTTVLNSISGKNSAVLTSQRDNYVEKTKRIDKDIETKERVLERRAEDLRGKLTRAQDAINSLKNQSSQLAASLAMPGARG